MERLRETLSPEDKEGVVRMYSLYKTPTHHYRLLCRECMELYFVDEATFRQAASALEIDPSNNLFICDRCEEEREVEWRKR